MIPERDKHYVEKIPSCPICNDAGGRLIEKDGHRYWSNRCECQPKRYHGQVWAYIYNRLPDRLKSVPNNMDDSFKLSDEQLKVYEQLDKGAWIHGVTGLGKSTIVLEKVRQILRNEPEKFLKVRYITGEQLEKLINEQYDNYQYKEELENMNSLDMVIFDDIDKVGIMTEHKAYKIFNLMSNKIDCIKYVFITGNVAMLDFCKSLKLGSLIDPLYGRFMDKVTEYKL